jgi:hypothetical protein
VVSISPTSASPVLVGKIVLTINSAYAGSLLITDLAAQLVSK